MTGPRLVIFNDTRPDLHHGCSRVMAVLEAGLESRGCVILARSPLRHEWWRDKALLAEMAAADGFVINGEGTLHDGGAAGAGLLRLAEHPLAAGRRLHLVNALYERNPAEWGGWLARFDGLWARDRASAAGMEAATGRPVAVLPDLTLCAGPLAGGAPRHGVIWGDSVSPRLSGMLADMAHVRGEPLVPSVSQLKRPKGRTAPGRWLRQRYIAAHEVRARRRWPGLSLAATPEAYAAALGTAALHVTGRFHGVCYSLLTGTPFLALRSNTAKIENLLADAGLDPARLVRPEALEAALTARDWAFSDDETAAIAALLARGEAQAAAMFDEIAGR